MPRPKKTAAQLQLMREKILDAAYTLLQEEGPEALTSRAIAEQLGIAHMSLFTYFKNQAAILSALSERELAKWREKQQAIEQRAETEDIVGLLQEELKFYSDFARENPSLYRLAWVMPEVGGESLEQNRQRMRNNVAHLAILIKLGIERGCFIPREPFLVAATVMGMVNMPNILFFSGKIVDPELRDRMVEEVLCAAMGYLQR